MKQRNLPWLGVIVESLYTSLPILSIINFLSIVTILYTSIEKPLEEYAPWLTFWVFVSLIGLAVLSMMTIVWKFVVPSLWTYRGKQMQGLTKGLAEQNKKIDKLLVEVEKLNADAAKRKDSTGR